MVPKFTVNAIVPTIASAKTVKSSHVQGRTDVEKEGGGPRVQHALWPALDDDLQVRVECERTPERQPVSD